MSAIDKLKNGSGIISFDATAPTISEKTIKPGQSMDIDMMGGDEKVSVEPTEEMNMSSLGKGKHQVVLPKESQTTVKESTPAPVARSVANIMEIGNAVPVDEDIHISPEHDMLDIDNPDSIFSKYVAQKDAEAAEWVAEKEEERRVLEEEKANSSTDNAQIGVIEDEEFGDDEEGVIVSGETENLDQRMVGSYNMANVEHEDLSGLMDTPVEQTVEKETVVDEFDPEIEIVEEKNEEKSVADFSATQNIPVSAAGEVDVDVNVVTTSSGIDDEVIEEDNSAMEDDSEDILKHLQRLATEKLKPVSKKLDISSFTVLKKPVSNVTPMFKESSARVAKWVLPTQDSIVLMKEFSGSELEKMREYSENSRSVDALNRRFKMIYDHIMSPKPAAFDTWLKSTPFDDVDSYFFAIYIASFKGANYLPADCINPQCKETFLSDNVDIMSMVEFENDTAKKAFLDLYQSEAAPAGKGIYCTEIVPMNNKIAISFRQPSIYNVFEIAAMDDKTRADFSDIVDYIPYIDTIYQIDVASQQLIPIGYKMFADNNQRTIRSKVYKFHQILSTLTVDEFAIIKAYTKAIAEKNNNGIFYTYPAIECPKCHTVTESQRTTAEELVFTRYQLGTLVNTSLN